MSGSVVIPAELAAKIGGLNAHWMARGMPLRCVVPSSADGWSDLVRTLPGYDPFNTEKEGLWFDVKAAANAIAFFHEYLLHIKGEWAGKPIWLEPWQQAFLGNLFGWKREDGTRRYRRWLLYVPRKNAKTTIAAGIQLHLLINDGEPGSECYCGAAEREQARLLFDLAKQMVLREPDLSERIETYQYELVDRVTHGKFKVLSADAHTKHGFNVHSAILDELHNQPNRDLYEVLDTGTAARRQPLMGAITTADYERVSICNEMHDHARAVRDGVVDDWQYLPAIWEASLTDDPHDPAVWRKANPNLGVSVSLDYLESASMRAKSEPAYYNTFCRLHLNIRTQQVEKWMDMARWGQCGNDPGEPGPGAEIGLDLASTEDFTAMALVWPEPHGVADAVGVRMFYWMPEDKAKDRESRGVPVLTWARQGLIKVTPGSRIEYKVVLADIIEVCKKYRVRCPAIDPWNADMLVQSLGSEGIEPVLFSQAMSRLSTPTKHLETLVSKGLLAHGGDPVLTWMVGNCTLNRDGMDNIRPSKKHSAEKIDGVIALVMALGMLIKGQDDSETASVYEERGLLVL